MSNWTHVAGVIRLDQIRFDNDIPDFDKIFGRECSWNDSFEIFEDAFNRPEKYLPMGSEGSLQKTVWVNPDKSDITAYVVTIFGDLRNHDSIEDIINWFKEKCKLVKEYYCSVRQATINVENEWYGAKTWSIDEQTSE